MSRGKEFKGQTLTIDGSRSGASVPITRLAYDSAFNLEYIGESGFGISESDNRWYIEKLAYDSAFNLISIDVSLNRRLLGEVGDTISEMDNIVSVGDILIFDINVGDRLNASTITEINGSDITVSEPLGVTDASEVTVTLEHYTTKDFSKRAWVLRNFYIYG